MSDVTLRIFFFATAARNLDRGKKLDQNCPENFCLWSWNWSHAWIVAMTSEIGFATTASDQIVEHICLLKVTCLRVSLLVCPE